MPNRCSGASADNAHKIAVKETIVTEALSSCRPIVERLLDEDPDVLGNALVRVVGGIAQQLHAIVVGVGEPVIEIDASQPAPPADLQPLIEIELVDSDQNQDGGQHAEITELVDEDVPVAILQRVVEHVVPGVEQHRECRRSTVRWRSPPPAAFGRASGPPNGNTGWQFARRWRASRKCLSRAVSCRERKNSGGWARRYLIMAQGVPDFDLFFSGVAYKKGISRASQSRPNIASGRRNPYDYLSKGCLIRAKERVVE